MRVFIHFSKPFKIPRATIKTVIAINKECQKIKLEGLDKRLLKLELDDSAVIF
tara:strand:- start:19 stop:177 length:159 start_codon:yes stop_codon:yes gene_type:complete